MFIWAPLSQENLSSCSCFSRVSQPLGWLSSGSSSLKISSIGAVLVQMTLTLWLEISSGLSTSRSRCPYVFLDRFTTQLRWVQRVAIRYCKFSMDHFRCGEDVSYPFSTVVKRHPNWYFIGAKRMTRTTTLARYGYILLPPLFRRIVPSQSVLLI